MEPALQVFIASLAIGLMLLAIEVFVPGGILGFFAGVSLLVAVVAGFFAFGPQGGLMAAFLLVIFGGLFLAVWIRIFPRTRVGKVLTLQKDGHDFKAADASASRLLNREGTAHTDLRPSGIAILEGRRTDVVSEAGYISAGQNIKVIRVEGNRIVVRAL